VRVGQSIRTEWLKNTCSIGGWRKKFLFTASI